jgi:hypothetical protein
MFKWTDVFAQDERYKDLLREAEQERVIRQLPHADSTINRLYWQVLSRLGEWLVAIGCRMQGHVDRTRRLVAQPSAIMTQPQQSPPCTN